MKADKAWKEIVEQAGFCCHEGSVFCDKCGDKAPLIGDWSLSRHSLDDLFRVAEGIPQEIYKVVFTGTDRAFQCILDVEHTLVIGYGCTQAEALFLTLCKATGKEVTE